MTRGVLTIAVGKPVYFNMAIALARSFEIWNADNDLEFAIVTDHALPFPPDLRKARRIQIQPGELPPGFESKLHLDLVSPFEKTLFVDSDCLCFADLRGVFEQFQGLPFSTVGEDKSVGEWFGDIGRRCREFQVPAVPVFVGAIYYFERGGISSAVFRRAREIVPRYDDLGMVRLRDRPNEEPLISIAMAENRLKPIEDDGGIKADAMYCDAISCNIFTGVRTVRLRGGRITSPAILHFNADFAERPPYTTERLAMTYWREYRIHKATARAIATTTETYTYMIKKCVKDALRPFYVKLFGHRKVISADR